MARSPSELLAAANRMGFVNARIINGTVYANNKSNGRSVRVQEGSDGVVYSIVAEAPLIDSNQFKGSFTLTKSASGQYTAIPQVQPVAKPKGVLAVANWLSLVDAQTKAPKLPFTPDKKSSDAFVADAYGARTLAKGTGEVVGELAKGAGNAAGGLFRGALGVSPVVIIAVVLLLAFLLLRQGGGIKVGR